MVKKCLKTIYSSLSPKSKKISKKTLKKSFLIKKRLENITKISQKKTKILTQKKISENFLLKTEKITKKDLICPICYDFLIKPRTTFCGHSFCDKCYFENMLKFNICPICRSNIKKSRGCFSLSYEKIIKTFISRQNKLQLTNYQHRLVEYKTWKTLKHITKFEIGVKYDVKDTENIWCIGIIKKIVKNIGHSDTLFISYLGWDKIYDEFLCSNSERIAPLGFFTKRRDIPRYAIHNSTGNMMMSFIVWERDYQRDFLVVNQRLGGGDEGRLEVQRRVGGDEGDGGEGGDV